MSVINFIFSQSKQYVTMLITMLGGLFVWFIKKDQRLEDENSTLNNNLTEMNKIDEQLIETQKEENKIESEPAPTRDDINEWLSRNDNK